MKQYNKILLLRLTMRLWQACIKFNGPFVVATVFLEYNQVMILI